MKKFLCAIILVLIIVIVIILVKNCPGKCPECPQISSKECKTTTGKCLCKCDDDNDNCYNNCAGDVMCIQNCYRQKGYCYSVCMADEQ